MLTDRELATVLAALRLWQVDTPHHDPEDLADHFADVEPLDDDEINDLCERLNMQDKTALAPLTIAYVGIGVVGALDNLTDGQRNRIMDHHEGQLCVIDAALAAAHAANLDATECDGCHAYEIAEEFGAAFVAAEVARLT